MADIGNTIVYTTVDDELLLIGTDALGRTRTTNGGGTGGTTLVHHYRANLNKLIDGDIVTTVLKGETLPDGVAITYNFVNNGLSGFYSVIRVTGWDKNKLFIPQYLNNAAAFDDYAKTYRLEAGLASTELQIVIDYQFEDFQQLQNFPFEIFFYN